ncbi:protein UBASH3A homolog [Stegodyphus dumicola]|uniref:protein UBASH3A homolog n=1 Tax=Stegodyphus dumicola TaxID=202533 RepID=UPI0015AAB4C2|nr:protein UBASH3A homolog [Stegodyphus dumicola]
MKECNVKFSHVFCSPSLRCIETCTNVLKASDQSHLPINVEPGLFEWLYWYKESMPAWMSLEELRSYAFNVSLDYKPVIPAVSLLSCQETCEEYYMRSYLVTSKLLENYSGNLLFLGHAATLDTCSRQLTEKPPRNNHEMQGLLLYCPYASVTVVEENPQGKWHLVDPPFPPLQHSNNCSFQWQILL